MNKYILTLLGILMIGAFLILWLSGRSAALPHSMLDDGVRLYRVAIGGVVTDRAYIHAPFKIESESVKYLNVAIDLNTDGVIDTATEWVYQNGAPLVTAGENVRIPLTITDHSVGQVKPVDVVFYYSAEPLASEVISTQEGVTPFTHEHATINGVTVDDMDAVLHIDEVGNKRTGPTLSDIVVGARRSVAPVAHAQVTGRPDFYSAKHEGVPDHDQDYNECGPTAVGNSFTWLAQKYGFEELMPEDIDSTIAELKGDLQWDSGTSDEDMIPGKQLFVDRHNLPIEVHQIGERNDPDIHYKIYEEMKKGQAVEVSLQFYTRNENGEKEVAGGHVVTVTGVQGGPDFKGIRFSDSATDSGEGDGSGDLYSLEGNKLTWFWTDKEVEIEYAFAQSPIESVIDGSWTAPIGGDFLVGSDHQLEVGGHQVTKGISRFGFFNSFVDHPGDHYLGEPFTVVATVVRRAGERQYMFWNEEEEGLMAYWHTAGAPWTLDGIITGGGPLSPGRLVGRPTLTQVNGDRYRLEQQFVCIEPGLAKVSYEANVTWPIEDGGDELPTSTQARYAEQLKPQASFQIDSPIFKCLTTDSSQIDEPQTSVTESDPEPVCNGVIPDPDGVEIEVLKLDNECYPKSQFSEAGEFDPCKAKHWHGGKVFSLTGVELEDPSPNACGFGKVSEVPIEKVMIDLETASKFLGDIFEETLVPEVTEYEYDLGGLEDSYKGYGDNWKYGSGLEYDVEVEIAPEGE